MPFGEYYPQNASKRERTTNMNRQNIPPMSLAADMPAQITEIRLPLRSGRHNLRNAWEVRP